jgi:hypothetical protein
MNSPATSPVQDEIFSIEQLESRFEMLAVPPPSGDVVHPNWSCTLTFNSK